MNNSSPLRASESKKAQTNVSDLEDQIRKKELELAMLQQTHADFRAKYTQTVGAAFGDLDALVAQISRILANVHTSVELEFEEVVHGIDYHTGTRHKEARLRSEHVSDDLKQQTEIKTLYRKVAKLIHPDLCNDEEARSIRQGIMQAANAAYGRGDIVTLQSILENWEASATMLQSDKAIVEATVNGLTVAKLRTYLLSLEYEIELLKQTDLYRLRIRVEQAQSSGRDLLRELEAHARERIQFIENTLSDLVSAHELEQDHEI